MGFVPRSGDRAKIGATEPGRLKHLPKGWNCWMMMIMKSCIIKDIRVKKKTVVFKVLSCQFLKDSVKKGLSVHRGIGGTLLFLIVENHGFIRRE